MKTPLTTQRLTRAIATTFVATSLALASAGAFASVSFSASGYDQESGHNDSAAASINLVGKYLYLTLTNTTGVSLAQSDALTGVVFSLASTASFVSLKSVSLTSGSRFLTSKHGDDLEDVNLNDTWTDAMVDSPYEGGSFGIATTGFNGMFNAGDMAPGNGGPNYGIVGADTTTRNLSGGSYPFVKNSMTFKFQVAGALSESDFRGATFLFGTDGTGRVSTPLPPTGDDIPGGNVPEPGSIALLGAALMGALTLGRRRLARH